MKEEFFLKQVEYVDRMIKKQKNLSEEERIYLCKLIEELEDELRYFRRKGFYTGSIEKILKKAKSKLLI